MDISREVCQVVVHKALNDHSDVGGYVKSVHAKVEERGHDPVFYLATEFLRAHMECDDDAPEDTKIMLFHARNYALGAACLVYESMIAAREVHELNEQFA